MAINEKLTNKLREALAHVANVEEKKMFSGIAFMVDGKLCVTAGDDRIMCRIDPDLHDELAKHPGCATVVMKGREYRGYIWVNESVLTTKKQIDYWVKLALEFNPKAKASVKKTKSRKMN
jgi:TfoX/Sxy family transcriptional regulator of competence genes